MSTGTARPRVLFVNPPATDYLREIPLVPERLFSAREGAWTPLALPLGTLQVAAAVRDLCDVELLDCRVEGAVYSATPSNDLRHGTPPDLIARRVSECRPDVVGLAAYFATQIDNALEVAQLVKKACPPTRVAVGGPYVATAWERLIQEDAIDWCVVGEGERSFRELLLALRGGAPVEGLAGIVDKKQRRLVPRPLIEALDELPLPAYDLLPAEYFASGGPIPFVTSRGCPYDCNFCSVHLHMGRRFRYHSPSYVLAHLEALVEGHGVRRISFEDDNVSLQRDRWEAILDGLIERNWGLRWFTRNGIRADTLDRAILDKMKRAGCTRVVIPVESASDRVLSQIIRKKESVKTLRETIRAVHAAGIDQASFYVIGFPGETPAEMWQTVEFAREMLERYGSDPLLFFATPLLKTQLWDECVEKGLVPDAATITPGDWALATNLFGRPLILRSESFEPRDLMEVQAEYIGLIYEDHLRRKWGKANVLRVPSRTISWVVQRALRRHFLREVSSQ